MGEPWGNRSGPASRPGAARRALSPTWCPGPRELNGRPAEELGEGVRPVDRCVYIHWVVTLTKAPPVRFGLSNRLHNRHQIGLG